MNKNIRPSTRQVLWSNRQGFGPQYPANKMGCILEFKPEVKQSQAEDLIKEIEHLLVRRPILHKYNNDEAPVFYLKGKQ